MTVTTGGGSGVNGFLSGSPGGEYSLLTSFLNYAQFRTSGGSSHHVVTVTTGGGSGVNGFLSGSPGGEYSILTSS